MSNAFARLEDAFHVVSALEGEDRQAYLDTLADSDPALLTELRSLLAAESATSGTLDDVIPAVAQQVSEPPDRAGEQMGRFQLVERLGIGGVGSVYRAERIDPTVEQTVAIKLLNADRLTPELRANFEREQNILARLEHPLIARLIDVGLTADGEPFLAMEYVQGQDLLSYVRSRRLGLRATLGLFRRICEAIAYAHGQLVVHRDIKPNNILVSADGVPRILDFGIASLVEVLGNRGLATALSDHRGMTLAYASPEQLRREPSGAPTDIFALGVLLHHLLLDHVPFACADEAQRLRAIEAGLPELEQALAARQIGRLQAQELAAVIRRCLAFHSADRYSALGVLAQDLRSLRRQQPISLLAGSRSYRVWKYLRRNRTLVAGSVLSVLVLGVATVFYLTNLDAARALAEREAERAERTSDFLANLFENIDPDNSLRGDFRVTDLLSEAPQRIRESFADDPATAVRLLNLVARTLRKLGDFDGATAIQNDVAQRYGLFLDENPEALAETLFDRGYVAMQSGDYTEALALHERALALREAAGAAAADLAASQREVAYLYTVKGRFEESLALLEAPLAWYAQAGPEYRSQYAAVLLDRAGNFFAQSQPELAREPAERALAVQIEVHGEKHPLVAQALHNLSSLQRLLVDYRRAEKLASRAVELRTELFGIDHPSTLSSRVLQASTIWDRGYTNLAFKRLRGIEAAFADRSFRFRSAVYYTLALTAGICGMDAAAVDYAQKYRLEFDARRTQADASHPDFLDAQIQLLAGADQSTTVTLAEAASTAGAAASRTQFRNQVAAALAEYGRTPAEERTEARKAAFDAVVSRLSESSSFHSPDTVLWLGEAAERFLAEEDGPRARRYLQQAQTWAERVFGESALERALLLVTQAEWATAFAPAVEAQQQLAQARRVLAAVIAEAPEPVPVFAVLEQRLARLE